MEVLAVRGKGVDLTLRIGGSHITASTGSIATHMHMDYISVERGPLALDAPYAIAEIQS